MIVIIEAIRKVKGISFVITTYFLYQPNLGFSIFATPFGFFTLG